MVLYHEQMRRACGKDGDIKTLFRSRTSFKLYEGVEWGDTTA